MLPSRSGFSSSMKRTRCRMPSSRLTLALTITALALPLSARSSKPSKSRDEAAFSRKLSKDEQIRHALDRLTFGPRPGDFDRVRKMGVKKWIDQQLHPDRISENPVLTAKLAALETIRLSPLEVWRSYPQTPF